MGVCVHACTCVYEWTYLVKEWDSKPVSASYQGFDSNQEVLYAIFIIYSCLVVSKEFKAGKWVVLNPQSPRLLFL